jgi:maltose alpha-D-glucosyltransferase/alpha-amylase
LQTIEIQAVNNYSLFAKEVISCDVKKGRISPLKTLFLLDKIIFMDNKTRLNQYWKELYPEISTQALDVFLQKHKPVRHRVDDDDWYKDAIVYALYVDLFSEDFNGLIGRLDYLQDLGVNCLWLLPILDSPMRDAGFDIRNYDRIRVDLLGLNENAGKADQEKVFGYFLNEAHSRGIRVIFDIAINHCSDEHPWFVEAKKGANNPYRDYFIWSKDINLYGDARLLFKGIEDSNWEPEGGSNYFHRFFSFQPDLNYRNPDVLLAMSENLLYWQSMGVDGFRADAIPYLWKEENTSCENLPKTHTIVKFFRSMLDYVKPGSLLLAEACQKPVEVVKYMGEGDECHAAYHFPLMPMIYKSIAMENGEPIKHTLSLSVTPKIPEKSQWLTFLRVHDELSLELVYVSEEDRKFIHENYCHNPKWNFRLGEGVSARLSELMQKDVGKIGLAYSLMLTLTGTPVVYYGDEFGKLNDEDYYAYQIQSTGKDDTRFLVRGRVDWDQLDKDLMDENNIHALIYKMIKAMLNTRSSQKVFGRGNTQFLEIKDEKGHISEIALAYSRTFENEEILIMNNMSGKNQVFRHPVPEKNLVVLHAEGFLMDDSKNAMKFDPHGFAWFKLI